MFQILFNGSVVRSGYASFKEAEKEKEELEARFFGDFTVMPC